MLPSNFQEKRVRLYCKDPDKCVEVKRFALAYTTSQLINQNPPLCRLFSEWRDQHEMSASSCSSSGPPSPSYSQSSSPLLDSFPPVPHGEAPGMEAPMDAVEHTPERTPLPPSVSTAPNSPSEPPAACRRLEMP